MHARYGAAEASEVVAEIRADGVVKIRRASRALTRAQVRRALELIAEYRVELMRIWEEYC